MAWFNKNRLWLRPLRNPVRLAIPRTNRPVPAKHHAPWYRAAQRSAETAQRIGRALSARRIAIPVLLGLGAAIWLFSQQLGQPITDPATVNRPSSQVGIDGGPSNPYGGTAAGREPQ